MISKGLKLLYTTIHKLKSVLGAVRIVFSCQVILKSPSTKIISFLKGFLIFFSLTLLLYRAQMIIEKIRIFLLANI